MERERGSKVIAIVALCAGVIGLSLGFAAFASNLTIKSSATVSPEASTFNVDFTTTSGSVVSGDVTATVVGATADPATIDNAGTDSEIENLVVHFTEPGQSATYSFYAHNAGEYVAYLNDITFNNVSGEDKFKVCTAGEGTDQGLVDAACANIKLTLTVGEDAALISTDRTMAVSEHALASKTSEPVTVKIEYTGTDRADGDFTVAFGDIGLSYSAVK